MSTTKSVNVDVGVDNAVRLHAGNGALLFPPREFPDQTRARAFGRRVANALARYEAVELTFVDRSHARDPKLVKVQVG